MVDAASYIEITETEENASQSFWRDTEEALHVQIPAYLKNLMGMNGHANRFCMADFDVAKQVPLLEKFAREDLPYLISAWRPKREYYGIYENCPERFKIVGGHVHILVKTAEHWRKIREDPATNSAGWPPSPGGSRGPAEGPPKVTHESVRESGSQSRPAPRANQSKNQTRAQTAQASGVQAQAGTPFNAKKEEDHLRKIIKENFLRDSTVKSNEAMRRAVSDFKAFRASVTRDASTGRIVADIKCLFCQITLRAHKIGSGNYKSRWITSNYVRHVMEKHFSVKPGRKSKRIRPQPQDTNENSSVLDRSRTTNQTNSAAAINSNEGQSSESNDCRESTVIKAENQCVKFEMLY